MREKSFTESILQKWFPGKAAADDAAALVKTLNPSGTTEQLARILSDDHHESGFVGRQVNQWLGRVMTDSDTQVIEAIARKLKAGGSAVQNAIELRQKMHEFSQLEAKLKEDQAAGARAAELRHLEHEAKLRELQERTEALTRRAASKTVAAIEVKRDELELLRIQAEIDALKKAAEPPPPAAPAPPALSRSEQFIASVENELAKMLRDHASLEITAQYVRERLEAQIKYLRAGGKEREAEGLEMYMGKKLSDLETGGL